MSEKKEPAKTARHPLITQDYSVDNPIHGKFFENSKFCSKLKVFLQESFPVQIEIKQSNIDDKQQSYTTLISGESTEHVRSCHNEIKSLFLSIRSQTCADKKGKLFNLSSCSRYIAFRTSDQDSYTNTHSNFLLSTVTHYSILLVQSTLTHHPTAVNIIQRILNHKREFAVCQLLGNNQYEIYYFHFKKPFYIHDIDKTIKENVIDEILEVPTDSFVSRSFLDEFEKMIKQDQEKDVGETMTSICPIDIFDDRIRKNNRNKKRQQLSIFGYYKTVNTFKQKYQDFFNQHQVTVFKIEINPSQVRSKNMKHRIS